MTNLYKIKHKTYGKYLKGTPTYHGYDLTGSLFTMKQLRMFLTNVMNSERRRDRLNEWEIVEFVLEQQCVKKIHEVITREKLMELLMA